jgi:hypothetical protein
MKITLENASGLSLCRSGSCLANPDYINTKTGRIKANTTCAVLAVRSASGVNKSYFCKGCLEKLYNDIRIILDPTLWVFH